MLDHSTISHSASVMNLHTSVSSTNANYSPSSDGEKKDALVTTTIMDYLYNSQIQSEEKSTDRTIHFKTREILNEIFPLRTFTTLKNCRWINSWLEELSPSEYKDNTLLFITSNEEGQTRFLELLTQRITKIKNNVHIGVSCLYNWDLVIRTRPDFAILIDINPSTVKFNKEMLEHLCNSSSPEIFLELALKQIEKEIKEGNPKGRIHQNMRDRYLERIGPFTSLIDGIKLELEKMGNGGALSGNSFLYLRQMAQEGRIACCCLDLNNASAITRLASALSKDELQVSSLYLSNVFDDIEVKDREQFQNSIQQLIKPTTCVIDSCPSLAVKPRYENTYSKNILKRWDPGILIT